DVPARGRPGPSHEPTDDRLQTGPVDMHDKIKTRARRGIPAVNNIVEAIGETDLPRRLIVDVVRRELAAERSKRKISAPETIVQRVRERVDAIRRSRLQTIINGTGIIIHTNLGRAPLALEAAEMLRQSGSSYVNLKRGWKTGAG